MDDDGGRLPGAGRQQRLGRAERRGIKLKVWKSDVEPAPPDATYDVILCMDVLEHLPRDVLHDVVDKLIKLKHDQTEVIISAPFGRTATHPMHMDLSEDTKRQIAEIDYVTGSDAAFAVVKQALRIADAPYERAFAFADLGVGAAGA